MNRSYRRETFRTSFRIVAILGALCIGVSLPARALADGIFDDDWSPPLKTERPPQPPKLKPVQPPPADPEPHPAPPTPPAAEATPTTHTDIKKIPSKSELAASRKLLKEAYGKELADRSAKARRAIAQKLLNEAKKNDDSPADQFALFGGAIEAAREGGTIPVCFDAIDELSGRYNVDGLTMKADAVVKLSPVKGDPPAIAAENIQSTLDLLDALVVADEFQSAGRVGVALQKLAQPAADQREAVQASIRKMNELRIAYQRLSPQLDTLKVSPHDPDANLAVGKYYCFQKGQWQRGLPMLAIGSDATLKALAEKEAAAPTDGATALSIGDAWWDLGPKEGPAAGTQIRIHAATWYRMSLEGLKGLARIKIEKRIADIPDEASLDDSAIGSAKAGRGRRGIAGWPSEIKAFCMEGPLLNFNQIPNEFDVTYAAGKGEISGVKHSDALNIGGIMRGHFGKAVTWEVPKGTILNVDIKFESKFPPAIFLLFYDTNRRYNPDGGAYSGDLLANVNLTSQPIRGATVSIRTNAKTKDVDIICSGKSMLAKPFHPDPSRPLLMVFAVVLRDAGGKADTTFSLVDVPVKK